MSFDRIVAWVGAIAAFGMIIFLLTVARAAAAGPATRDAWPDTGPVSVPGLVVVDPAAAGLAAAERPPGR